VVLSSLVCVGVALTPNLSRPPTTLHREGPAPHQRRPTAKVSGPLEAVGGRGHRSAQPNIVVLIIDDLSAHNLPFHGHLFASTPHMDALASSGVILENAFVTTPLCSPARAGFLTGIHTRRSGIGDNRTPLGTKTPTLGSLLREAGYECAAIGKWHMGMQMAPLPGFARSATYAYQGQYRNCRFSLHEFEEPPGPPTSEWVDDSAADHAVAFIRQEREQPYFLWVGFKSVHGPFDPPVRHTDAFLETTRPRPPNADAFPPYPRAGELRRWNQQRGMSPSSAAPADWLEQRKLDRRAHWMKLGEQQNWLTPKARTSFQILRCLDDAIGRIIAAARATGQERDTLIVLTSDSGRFLGEHGLTDKRAAYEESIRIPLVLSWPGVIPANERRAELASNLDLLPTLVELAGSTVPQGLDGRSLVPLLEARDGQPVAGWRDSLFLEYYGDPQFAVPTWFAVRTEEAKLVSYPRYPEWTQLFDLRHDPHERENLAHDPEQAELRSRLEAWLAAREEALGKRLTYVW